MKWLAITLALALPSLATAANGDRCVINPPSSVDTASTINNTAVCIDVCDITNQDGALTCGPVWVPDQNADATTFEVIAASGATCPFDSVDIVKTNSGTFDSALHQVVYGTLDDDSGCGASGTSPCKAVVVPYPISGWVYIHSNSQTVGSGTCTSFKIRMTQGRTAK